ncbi:MAG: long-chain fatty acid--CoA ligase [Ignavibacteriae bacterium HGW-Ignavibacteriae-1]|jgi:long-chain acyl-CoA synthetase|nr:MAG: long-chain fatty acid--CoA ligase [Ignavibacteriae bacterium HGW-Ignavibacteriae-1]
MKYKNIPDMFFQTVRYHSSEKPAFLYKSDGKYNELTYGELQDRVEKLALGLLELGFHKGDRIGLISENRIEWIIVSFAINLIGAIDVPLFPILSAKQEEDIFTDCGVSAVIVSNQFQLSKILQFKENIASLRHVIVMNDDYDSNELYVKSLKELEERGGKIKNDEARHEHLLQKAAAIQSEDLLTLIYTSGTTGTPKGVMLTHKNILSNIEAVLESIGDLSQDIQLSYLPLCHTYERTGGFLALFSCGALIALAESVETVATNIQEIKPTMMTTVPKLLETVKKKIFLSMEKESGSKRFIFKKAIDIGYRKVLTDQEGKINPMLNLKYKIVDRLVFSKIRAKLGGRMNKFISGGAPISEDVEIFFNACGIRVVQGYGLTEASPIVANNTVKDNEIGTVGKPLDNLELRIAEDGEILVRGPSIMKGYWNDPVGTSLAVDEEGWLYTGDIGEFTMKGNLKITDRKKDIFVSSGGKNIAPQAIENLLSRSRFIDHCVLIGDNREFISALITPNFDQLKDLAVEFGVEYNNLTELIANEKIIAHIKKDIDFYQSDLSKYERVRKFQLLSEAFSVDSGELSPKMSIKRHVVESKYSYLIEMMYEK